jgi:hypothetical protein
VLRDDALGAEPAGVREDRRAVSFRAKVAFLCDPFVGLAWPLNLIFEVAVPLGQLLCHLVCAARSITIEHGGLQRHRLTELEFVRALGAVHLGSTHVGLAGPPRHHSRLGPGEGSACTAEGL